MQATMTVEQRSDAALTGKRPWLRLLPEDGWLTLILLIIVVYTTTASIQAVTPAWAPGLGILTTTTGMGLLLGYLAVQQGRLPGYLVHVAALILGIAFAFQQTANATLNGDRKLLLEHTQIWFQHAVLNHESSNDNTVFLLFLAILSFLLAYISIWLVLHTRRPWLAALANGVVLMINLNWATQERAVFFIVLFLLATLLLLVRFTLAENVRQWRARGLRFSPDLGWDFMQAGAIFAVVVLTLANLLPAGAGNGNFLSAWNSSSNPWQNIASAFQTAFSGVQGGRGPGVGGGFTFFGTNLSLLTNPDLKSVPIMRYTTVGDSDPTQYLITQTMDQYTESNGSWDADDTSLANVSRGAFDPLPASMSPKYFKVNEYEITLDQTLGGNPLFAPGSVAFTFSVASTTTVNDNDGQMPVKWTAQNGQRAGTKYATLAYVSTATQDQLQSVPYPQQLASNPQELNQEYPPQLLQQYLYSANPAAFPTTIQQDATTWTKGAANMYDAATAIESTLRSSDFRYTLTPPSPPPGQDPLLWFLQKKVGFCTYFATAMVQMARSLGMPARIALGFSTSGAKFNSTNETYTVLGTSAHVWPQIYFGNFGWINFEPTTSFPLVSRPNTASTGSATPGAGAGNTGTTPKVTPHPGGVTNPGGVLPGGAGTGSISPVVVGAGLGLTVIIILALLGLVMLITWWRLLYRGLSPVAGAFARIAHLGAWAGEVPKRSQTPAEYMEKLGRLLPGQRTALRKLSDLYGRERWGGGLSEEASEEVPQLYGEVRESVSRHIVERIRALPVKTITSVRRSLVGNDGYNGANRTP